jgi:hypothetical protein
MEASTIVSVLVGLSREGLEQMRDDAKALQTHIAVEIEMIEAALEQQVRRDGRGSGRGPGGETRQLVLDAVASSSEPVTPAQVVDSIKALGTGPSKGAIRNMVQRLAREGDLERVSAGLYRIAHPQPITSRRVSAFARPDQPSPTGSRPRGGDQEQSGEAGPR